MILYCFKYNHNDIYCCVLDDELLASEVEKNSLYNQ